jgi:hypothetical protein
MFRPQPLIAALAVLVISGLAHGLWTQRWHSSQALDDAAARLATVPTTAGHWRSVNVDVDPAPYRQAGAVGYWMRRYTRTDLPGSVSVILMCGQARHMAIHTPDICYRGAGYEMAGEQTKAIVTFSSGGNGEFWTAHFRQSTRPAGATLHLCWSWSSGGSWQAPSSPRWTFGGSPYLYKLYVVYETPSDGPQDRITTQFLEEFMPVLQQSLFSAETPGP